MTATVTSFACINRNAKHAEEAFFIVCGGIKPDALFADGIPPVGGGGGAGRRGGEECRDEKEQEDEFHTRYRSASARAGGRVF